jgi:hypothetical protein
MARNGRRKPPRPRIETIAAVPGPEEAAAISAALERFLADTAPAPAPPPEPSPWLRAALIEGVSAKRPPIPPDPGSGFPLS